MAHIGLFGGSFNPIHVGHLTLAEEARMALHLDSVIFIPSGNPYFKDPASLASQEDRFTMTCLATASRPCFRVSDMEIKTPGPSYTCVTVEAFRRLYPEDFFVLLLGADSLLQIESWKEPARIFDAVEVAVMTRGGYDESLLTAEISRLESRYHARIRLLDSISITLSSSELRSWHREGHGIRHLVTEPVYNYITTHHLYEITKGDLNETIHSL